MNLNEYKKKQLLIPEFKKEFEKYDLAFEIGLLILKARIRRGYTQEKLAKLIKTKQSSIARAENGMNLPSLSFLEKIAKALKTYVRVNFGMFENESKIEFNSHFSLHDSKICIIREGFVPNLNSIEYYSRVNSINSVKKNLIS